MQVFNYRVFALKTCLQAFWRANWINMDNIFGCFQIALFIRLNI